MDSMEQEKDERSFVEKAATIIVDKRNAFFLVFIGLCIFCAVASGWVSVNNDISSYLPETTETRRGLDIMDEEFTTFATAKVMVDHVSYEKAQDYAEQIEALPQVKSVEFDDTQDHYRDAGALYDITFTGEADDPVSEEGLAAVEALLQPLDVYVSAEIGDSDSEQLDAEMNVVMVIAVVIIVTVLLFTSRTYMEVPVLLITFGAAAILNKGTNFMLGEISFVSNSVAVVLQLALAIDYAIILCHRYMEEREHLPAREAVITALSKAIPEISGSSLTTISGLMAMMFMHFKIGYDMGLVLIKSICFSLLSVFTLMPGLLMVFSKWIDRTHHKNFVPDITVFGKFVVKIRYVVPPLFAVVLAGAFWLSNQCSYVYGYTTLSTVKQSESQLAQDKIDDTFGSTNMMALLVPTGDYKTEKKLLAALDAMEQVDSTTGIANVEARDGYMLADELTPRQFAELADLDIEAARFLYAAYAAEDENYGQIVGGIDQYGVPLIDMFDFLYEQKEKGYVELDQEMEEDLDDLHQDLTDAKLQLLGDSYSRMLIYANVPEESQETFDFLKEVHQIAESYYDGEVFLVGNSTNEYDLSSSFVTDNVLISILSAVFVIIVLLFTFQSAGLPLLLILVIQGSIWINFSFPVITDTNLFFLSYLVVSSIQMGANIDYAIVITSRYTELKKKMPIQEAMAQALNQAFPTIVTSGTILASAGVLIGLLSSDPAIASIGECLGRGTIISIFLVMVVLPAILLVGDVIVERTALVMKKPALIQSHSGNMRVNGHVRGYVSGMIDAEIRGTVNGSIHAAVDAGGVRPETEEWYTKQNWDSETGGNDHESEH